MCSSCNQNMVKQTQQRANANNPTRAQEAAQSAIVGHPAPSNVNQRILQRQFNVSPKTRERYR
jgi:hypothetical protein